MSASSARRRHPHCLRRPWRRATPHRRIVLAQPSAARLGEPGLAALPGRPRGARHARPLRRAWVRDVRLACHGLLDRCARHRSRGRRRGASDTSGSRSSGCRTVRASPWPMRPATLDRVTRLILDGTVCGERTDVRRRGVGRGTDLSEPDPSRLGAGGPRLRRVFTSRVSSLSASEDQMRWFDALQRMSGPPRTCWRCDLLGRPRTCTADVARIAATNLDPAGGRRSVDDLRERRHGRRAHPWHAGRATAESRNHIILAGERARRSWSREVEQSSRPIGELARPTSDGRYRGGPVSPRARRTSARG